jgi:hypothetical protein
LSNFLNTEDARKLARLLEETVKAGEISYETAINLIGDDAEDMLILGYGWKLILPIRAAKGGDWEDLMIIPQPGEKYQTPNVVKHLVEHAQQTGHWDPEKAIIDVFKNIGEPEADKMPRLVERMASKVKGHRINGLQIKKICSELGLVERVDPLVSELKACGILSHKLNALADIIREGAPIYEINPALLVG